MSQHSSDTPRYKRYRQFLCGLVAGDGLRARLIRGGLGSAGIQAANRIMVLALGIVLARMLGPEGYGVYAYAFAVMSLLMVAAEAGVPTLLMREVAASQGRAEWGLLRGALRRGTQFVALAATMVSLIGLFVLWWLADSLRTEVLYTTTMMLMVLPATALCKTVAHALRGLHHVVLGQAVNMLIRPLLVLIIVAGIFAAWPERRQPHVAMAAQLFGALVVLLIGALVLRRFMPADSRAVAPEYKSRLWLKSALPFTLIGGAGIINNQTDIIMIGWFMDSENVGIYRVAAQGSMLVAFGLQAINAVLGPQFSRLYAQKDMRRLSHLAKKSSQVLLFFSFPLAAIFALKGDMIIIVFFGKFYDNAYLPLVILTIGQLINALVGPVGMLLNMTNKEKVNSRLLWLAALINILINLLLIPIMGVLGAAIATTFSLIIRTALQLYFVIPVFHSVKRN